MRAVLVREHGAPAAHALEEVDPPPIGAREALVDVQAIGVNFPDLLVIGGTYQVLPPRPFVPGKDAAGVVRAVGSGRHAGQAGGSRPRVAGERLLRRAACRP